VTHTKRNVIQYNACLPKLLRRQEYYPFGLQAGTSWTRESSSNNFLYNGGNELNSSSGWYETFFRGYDPTLGRFLQIDPMATTEMATYQYAGNNPVLFNDPFGASKGRPDTGPIYYKPDSYWAAWGVPIANNANLLFGFQDGGIGAGSGNHWTNQYNSVETNFLLMPTGTFERFYGVDLSNDEQKFNIAKSMSSPFVNEKGEVWNPWEGDYVPAEEILSYEGDAANQKGWYRALAEGAITQDGYRARMSQQELAIFDAMTQAQQIKYLANGHYAQGLAEAGFERNTLHNGKGDAFRHALFSALNARDLGLDLAKKLGDAHELHPIETPLGREMDLYNNQIGRDIFSLLNSRGLLTGHYSTEGIAIVLMRAVERGYLREILNGVLVPTKK